VYGTVNVLRAAEEAGVGHFVNISTDKAADPTCVLGTSKRIAERLTAEVAARTGLTYLSVRFGNVLGSRGSVLSAFAAQAAAGGPLTVTDPEVTRYFMTVTEAVRLSLLAAAIGSGGEVLVLDMGAPVPIVDVARQIARLAPHPAQIVFTGLRPGEKLHEQLLGADEPDIRPHHPLITQVPVPPLHPGALTRLAGLTGGRLAAELHRCCGAPASDGALVGGNGVPFCGGAAALPGPRERSR
jgi:FlaA1/EpsC-like NDP-sugar epimerase